jgi:hypothetical protein
MITDTIQNTQLSIDNNHSFKLIYIYQITCKDLKISDNYIGKTDCLKSREYSHYNACKDSDLKVYKIMRENGGWNNWQMKILNHYYCKDEYDVRQIEQKYIDFYKSNMNSINAYSKPFKNEELDRQIEFELNNYSEKILGCFLYDFLYEYDENEMICEYCENIYYDKSNLVRHQKTSKFCIKIQIEKNENIKINKFICEFCDKKLTTKQSLNRHLNTCKNKEIKNLQNEIKDIKNTINNTNNNTTINNIFNNTINNITINNIDFMSFMTAERIKEIFDKKFNIETLFGAEKSLANFTIENFLSGKDKPIYLCTDKERNKFIFLDKNNKKINDTNAQILIDLIMKYGFNKIKKSYNNHCKIKPENLNNAFNSLMNIKKDGKEYINHLSNNLPKTIEERQIKDDVQSQNSIEDVIIFEDDDIIDFDEISNIPLYEFNRYREHYIKTGKIMVPSKFEKTKENIDKLKKYFYYNNLRRDIEL